jgi:hypothetical protein
MEDKITLNGWCKKVVPELAPSGKIYEHGW